MRTQRLIVLSILTLASACDENVLNPMYDRQPRAEAFKASVFFDDMLSMRPPPRNTIAREWLPGRVGVTTGRTTWTGPVGPNGQPVRPYVQQLPVPLTPALLALGRSRYDIFCAACHGLLGDGDSVVARQMAQRPPPSLHLYADRPVGYLFEVVTQGFGLMASYASELNEEERWAVVAYVQALQLSQALPLGVAPPEVRARLLKEAR